MSEEDGAVSRRALVVGAGATALLGAAALATRSGAVPLPGALRRRMMDQGPGGVIPDVPQHVTLEQRTSAARGRTVGFYTAVPDGFGDGTGLPVCLVLHGASATTADFEQFGLGRFLTAAVRAGTAPFALAGADGGRTYWLGDGAGDDPQRLLTDELPAWCRERGFDTSRLAAYGWSMGGFGSLFAAATRPGWLRGVAALSPAVAPGDEVFARAHAIIGEEIGLWCGRADPLYDNVRAFAAMIPGGPAIAAYAPGAHTRGYWNRITPEAFTFIADRLT